MHPKGGWLRTPLDSLLVNGNHIAVVDSLEQIVPGGRPDDADSN